MALIVQKFGGSSVGSIEKIQRVANKIIETRKQGHDLAVVVSAMEGETNRLISLAKNLGEDPDAREYDLLLATGEQAATALLAMALLSKGCPARSYNGFHIPIYTDNHHKKARILHIEESLLRKDIATKRIPVVAGFQGVSQDGNMTTLGRGGSDTTAAALAAILKADECQIYTDVDGVYTADPRIVAEATRLDTVGFMEMTEFARAGAKVVQHRAVELASQYRIPLRVLSSFKEGKGTLIHEGDQTRIERPMITGITASRQEAKITLHNLSSQKAILARFFSLLNEARIEIDMLTQHFIDEKQSNVTFTVARTDCKQVLDLLQLLIQEGQAKTLSHDTEVAKLSIIGLGLHSHPGIMHTLFHTLESNNIKPSLVLSSAQRISLIMKEPKIIQAIQILHHVFSLGNNEK